MIYIIALAYSIFFLAAMHFAVRRIRNHLEPILLLLISGGVFIGTFMTPEEFNIVGIILGSLSILICILLIPSIYKEWREKQQKEKQKEEGA